MKKWDIITIFPGLFEGFKTESLISRAIKNKLLKINTHYLRKWTTDRHQTVDGRPFGGGVGLVFKIEPIFKAVKAIQKLRTSQVLKSRVILFSPRGERFMQADAKRLAKYDQLIFICGRYEGVDERVAEHIADEVISIGDYVLSGGELPAMVVMEAVSRHIKGVVGKEESVDKADHATYTRPEVFEIRGKGKGARVKKLRVPKILLSGDHKKIEEWRKNRRLK